MKYYMLTEKGKYEFDQEFIPICEILESGSQTIEGIKQGLENFVAYGFAVCKEIDRGMGDPNEIEKWMKRLAKKGHVEEIRA